jgi:hypothetical protein
MILFEFKNFDAEDIGHTEVNQTKNYMTDPMGNLAIMICSKEPIESAHRQRNSIFSQDKKIILFITKEQLKEMLAMKDRGEQPSDLIVDLIEHFYIQHE